MKNRSILILTLTLTMMLVSCQSRQTATLGSTAPTDTTTPIPDTPPTVPSKETVSQATQAIPPAESSTVPGCTVVSRAPQPTPEDSPFLPVGEKEWVLGPEDASITLIEYSDFQ